jgi:hypothetical protein
VAEYALSGFTTVDALALRSGSEAARMIEDAPSGHDTDQTLALGVDLKPRRSTAIL